MSYVAQWQQSLKFMHRHLIRQARKHRQTSKLENYNDSSGIHGFKKLFEVNDKERNFYLSNNVEQKIWGQLYWGQNWNPLFVSWIHACLQSFHDVESPVVLPSRGSWREKFLFVSSCFGHAANKDRVKPRAVVS